MSDRWRDGYDDWKTRSDLDEYPEHEEIHHCDCGNNFTVRESERNLCPRHDCRLRRFRSARFR